MPPMSEEERKARKREYLKAYYAANREKRLAYAKAYREANREKIAEQKKAYREANREKVLEQQKACYEANREKRLAYSRAYYVANRERELEGSKSYYEANKERLLEIKKAYNEANKESVAEYRKAYYEANKEKFVAFSAKRSALKKKLIPKPLRKCLIEKDRLLKIYKLRAIISEATGVEHHVDHMWPLADGGPHWSGNLQIITAEENLSKNASVCEHTKKTIQESLEYTLREYERNKYVGSNNT